MNAIPFDITLIGIGVGGVDHVSFQAIEAIQNADVILLPEKGAEKSTLLQIRERLCEWVFNFPLDNQPKTQPVVVKFDYPVRNSHESDPRVDYENAVDDWHEKIAVRWMAAIERAWAQNPHLLAITQKRPLRIALLVWGDASLYDSTLRIARRLRPVAVRAVAGISTPQALAAAHGLELCELGGSLLVTTGRNLREHGWPLLAHEAQGVDWTDKNFKPAISSVCVMLDGQASFQALAPALAARLHIWWGAFLGMEAQVLDAGTLAEAGPRIVATRAAARKAQGWVMDAYVLRWQG